MTSSFPGSELRGNRTNYFIAQRRCALPVLRLRFCQTLAIIRLRQHVANRSRQLLNFRSARKLRSRGRASRHCPHVAAFTAEGIFKHHCYRHQAIVESL